MIWTGTRDEFCSLIDILNHNDIGLDFTYEIHQDTLPFLDVLVTKSPQGEISTTTYRKPTATNSLLHWQSSYPMALKRGIPFGQFLRLRRNCTDQTLFIQQAHELGDRFLEKGYPMTVLRTAYFELSTQIDPLYSSLKSRKMMVINQQD